MIKNLKFKKTLHGASNKNFQGGITLVEVIVAIFIVAIFSAILIADYPKISRQFSLLRASHQLAQDLRRAEDLSLSGVLGSSQALHISGYGVYIDLTNSTQYIIYADNSEPVREYNSGDYIVQTVDISGLGQGVYIKELRHITGNSASINFSPPNPAISISGLNFGQNSIEIILGLQADEEIEKVVSVNTAGLIEVD